ncbi:hypothetical protein DXG01_002331, partial [Tephrocybe rancida]
LQSTATSGTHATATRGGALESVNDPVALGPAATSDATQAGTPSSGQKITQQETAVGTDTQQPLCRKAKTFSLNTYKFHTIGDYASTIQHFGTVDSYSTETARLQHIEQSAEAPTDNPQGGDIQADSLASLVDPGVRYHIGVSEHLKQDIRLFIRDNTGDVAIANFYPDLQSHLLARIKQLLVILHDTSTPVDPRSPNQERVFFKNDALYRHNILRINYTTYDVRRSQDVINPNTNHRDIMLLRPMTSTRHCHPYRYARVLGIYHVNAIYQGPDGAVHGPHRQDFVWVRWFEICQDLPMSARWTEQHLGLDQLTFPPLGGRDAFRFVDPSEILRSCHIIPRFCSMQRHSDGISLSGLAQDGGDWSTYYLNKFVDRDMLMRFHWGLGVGHVYGHTRSELGDSQSSGDGAASTTSPFLSDPLPQAQTLDNDSHEGSDDESVGSNDSLDSEDSSEGEDGQDYNWDLYEDDFHGMYGEFDDDEASYC